MEYYPEFTMVAITFERILVKVRKLISFKVVFVALAVVIVVLTMVEVIE